MAQPYVISVILNTNRRDDTLACLDSLEQQTYPHHKAIVLDNSSTDGSVEAITARFPHVEIVHLTQNSGYAGNNNVGIAAAIKQNADWIFVLNEDTVLAPDCIAKLVRHGEGDARIGMLGPMVYHADEPTVIQSAGGAMGPRWDSWHTGQNEADRNQFPHPRPVDWVSGCAVLVRRAVVAQVGMLDERFFYYWEEVEWCLRTRKAGWTITHVPLAKLWHKGVQRDYRPKPSVSYYNTRNRFLMMKKHGAPTGAWLAVWAQMLRTLTSWTVKPHWRATQLGHRDATLRGVRDFLLQRWGQGG